MNQIRDIITPEERAQLVRLSKDRLLQASGRYACDFLAALDDGVLPPQSAIDWFVIQFRSGR